MPAPLGDDQLGLFATAAAVRTAEGPESSRFCNWKREGMRPEVHPCVREPNHQGDHVVWLNGRIDVVVWAAGEEAGMQELFRGRIGGMRHRPLRPVEVLALYDAMNGLAEQLATE